MRSPRRVALVAALPCLVLVTGALAACTASTPHTGSSTAAEVGGVQQIKIKAGNNYRFTPSTITVHPGKVQIVLTNTGTGAPHNWQLPAFPADFVPLTAQGQTQEATFTAPSPGTYEFVCTIHEKQGQTGKLVVRSN